MSSLKRYSLDWAQWLACAAERPGTRQPVSDASSIKGDPSWTGSNSLEHALQVARAGWPEGTARLGAGMVSAARLVNLDNAPSTVYDVAGELPDVGRYLAGDPECMSYQCPEGASGARPLVRIAACGSIAAKLDTRQIENYGIAILTAVDQLEKSGRDVELSWYMYCVDAYAEHDAMLTTVTIKHAGEHLDLDRAAFALAHPSMFRRLCFAHMEQQPELSGIVRASYGHQGKALPQDEREQGVWYMPSMFTLEPQLGTLAGALACIDEQLAALANDNQQAA